MKKIVVTISLGLLTCTFLFMACEKSISNTIAAATTGSPSGIAGSINVDGTAHSVTTGTTVIGSTYVLVSNSNGGNYPSISINFAGTSVPVAGTYTVSPNYPTSGNCGASLTPSISITWTVVTCNLTVTSGSSKNVSFNGAVFTDGTNTHTVSANLPF